MCHTSRVFMRIHQQKILQFLRQPCFNLGDSDISKEHQKQHKDKLTNLINHLTTHFTTSATTPFRPNLSFIVANFELPSKEVKKKKKIDLPFSMRTSKYILHKSKNKSISIPTTEEKMLCRTYRYFSFFVHQKATK